MTTDGALKDDVKLPEGEIGQQIQDAFSEGKDLIITVLSASSYTPALEDCDPFSSLCSAFKGSKLLKVYFLH